MKLYSVEGNTQRLDGGAMFGNAPKTIWSKWVACDSQNRIPLACRSMLLTTDEHTILFEAGIGAYMEPKYRERFGVQENRSLLLENLAKLDVSENDVDYVVLSHLHFDHAGGMVPDWPAIQDDAWQPRFPQAKYIVGKRHFDHSMNPHPRDRASFVPHLAEKLKASGRLILIDDIHPSLNILNDFLALTFSDGHTPGLMHAVIVGEKETVFFCADLIPGLPWVHLPIVMGYDRFAERLIDEKKPILERAAQENWILFYTHDSEVAGSRISQDEKGAFKPRDLFTAIAKFEL
jgi:glyoxylase-like metal-dependent hydrolase (beta-lactamase superfamily II)